MAEKKPKKEIRKIFNLHVQPLESTPTDRILQSQELVHAVYEQACIAIQDAMKSRKKTATLFEVNQSSDFIEIERKDWCNALQQCIEYYSRKEDFEQCIKLQEVKSRLEPVLV